jgi:hypothetical protein
MLRVALVLTVLGLAVSAPARAEEQATATGAAEAPIPDRWLEGWRFSLAPYFWYVGIDGTVEAGGHSADVNVDFSDIWDALDIGVLTAAEARNGRFSVATNLIYLKGSTSAENPVGPLLPGGTQPGDFSVRSTDQAIIWELRPFWEVVSLPLLDDEHRIALDLGPGVRFFWIDSHLDVKLRPGVPVGPFQQRFDSRTNWADWLGVARVRTRLIDDLSLVVSGDYGGFDIGSSSHKTWSITAFANYRLSEHIELTGGWRKLSIDHGPVDLDLEGPLLGLSFDF